MAARKLQAHHDAWLRAHPDRNEDWLMDMLKEGFDVHHVDGDHDNNTPLNLVLIEAVDHMRLHGMNLKDGMQGWRRKLQEKSMIARARAKETPRPKMKAIPVKTAPAYDPLETKPYIGGSLHSGLNDDDVMAYQSRINRIAA